MIVEALIAETDKFEGHYRCRQRIVDESGLDMLVLAAENKIANLILEIENILQNQQPRQKESSSSNTHLGQLFSISQQDASAIFNNWIQYLFFRCGSVPIWPHRDIITISHMPPNQCYSDYKSCNTLKGLGGIDPRGSIIFASMPFAGSMSNKEINNQSGFQQQLKMFMDCGKIHKEKVSWWTRDSKSMKNWRN
ncbi:hypothetical protein MAR_005797 [Mya arenaria]|uniref:DDE Tnp4 domain-containing protein n=1 Tax=Mya arenaria TaxID=6604 RepID=A0ABY7F250_MYAAR|nr:hypothetical protein MAR_005797 [Mya arenaria]